MIAMYDLFDNYIMSFDSVKECAKYFNTTPKYIHYYLVKDNFYFLNTTDYWLLFFLAFY